MIIYSKNPQNFNVDTNSWENFDIVILVCKQISCFWANYLFICIDTGDLIKFECLVNVSITWVCKLWKAWNAGEKKVGES